MDIAKKNALSKYRIIVYFVILFLIFDIVILAINFYMSIQVEKTTTAINLSSRQGILTQQMAKNVMNIDLLTQEQIKKQRQAILQKFLNDRLGIQDEKTDDTVSLSGLTLSLDVNELGNSGESGKFTKDTVAELSKWIDNASIYFNLDEETLLTVDTLQNARQEFEKTLTLFEKGGTVNTGDSKVTIEKITDPKASLVVAYTKELWTPYQNLIDSFVNSVNDRQINPATISFAVDYARIFDRYLYHQTTELTKYYEGVSRKQTRIVQIAQYVGFFGAILFILSFMFFALRRLVRNEVQLEENRRETQQIMQTINEGLFLIDRDLVIGSGYSDQLEPIIGQKDLGGRKITDVLEAIISNKDLMVLRTFVKQLFNGRVVEDLIRDLNPLQKVKIMRKGDFGYEEERFLNFKFTRVYQGEEDIVKALVSVTDVTENILLEQQLNEEKEQNDQQIQLINRILQTEKPLMDSFANNSHKRIDTINNILKETDTTQSGMQDKLTRIYKEMHSLKGEASALKISNYVTLAENFERTVKNLQGNSNLSGNDFLPLAMILDEIVSIDNMIQVINGRSGVLPTSGGSQAAPTGQALTEHQIEQERIIRNYYVNFANDIAQRNGKKVKVYCDNLTNPIVPDDQREILKDIFLQFLRNAIVHGIEKPEQRLKVGKQETGTVRMAMSYDSSRDLVTIMVEDDGSGLNYDKIRSKLVDEGEKTQAEVDKMTSRDLVKLIFSSGFSTADNVNEDGGKGVGMGVVTDRVNELGGKLIVATKKNLYSRFTVTCPLMKVEKKEEPKKA